MSLEDRSTVGLLLEPLDVLFFREGLPFSAGFSAESRLPTPKTLAGALRTRLMDLEGYGPAEYASLGRRMSSGQSYAQSLAAVGKGEWIASVRFAGPWLCKTDGNGTTVIDVYTPAPATLHKEKKPTERRLLRLDPLSKSRVLPGWRTPQEDFPNLRPLWPREPAMTEAANGFLGLEGLKAFLNGGVPDVERLQWVEANDLYGWDRRVGIGVNEDSNSAQEGLVYSASFLSLKRELSDESSLGLGRVAFYAEVNVPASLSKKPFDELCLLALGGEGRRVRVTVVAPVTWPRVNPVDGRALYVLTTPGLFDSLDSVDQRVPARFPADQLIGAAVPGDLPVSGWDMASQGPKPNRFAVTAGSVYFLENNGSQNFGDSLSDSPDDEVGWGRYVKGVWNYA